MLTWHSWGSWYLLIILYKTKKLCNTKGKSKRQRFERQILSPKRVRHINNHNRSGILHVKNKQTQSGTQFGTHLKKKKKMILEKKNRLEFKKLLVLPWLVKLSSYIIEWWMMIFLPLYFFVLYQAGICYQSLKKTIKNHSVFIKLCV